MSSETSGRRISYTKEELLAFRDHPTAKVWPSCLDRQFTLKDDKYFSAVRWFAELAGEEPARSTDREGNGNERKELKSDGVVLGPQRGSFNHGCAGGIDGRKKGERAAPGRLNRKPGGPISDHQSPSQKMKQQPNDLLPHWHPQHNDAQPSRRPQGAQHMQQTPQQQRNSHTPQESQQRRRRQPQGPPAQVPAKGRTRTNNKASEPNGAEKNYADKNTHDRNAPERNGQEKNTAEKKPEKKGSSELKSEKPERSAQSLPTQTVVPAKAEKPAPSVPQVKAPPALELKAPPKSTTPSLHASPTSEGKFDDAEKQCVSGRKSPKSPRSPRGARSPTSKNRKQTSPSPVPKKKAGSPEGSIGISLDALLGKPAGQQKQQHQLPSDSGLKRRASDQPGHMDAGGRQKNKDSKQGMSRDLTDIERELHSQQQQQHNHQQQQLHHQKLHYQHQLQQHQQQQQQQHHHQAQQQQLHRLIAGREDHTQNVSPQLMSADVSFDFDRFLATLTNDKDGTPTDDQSKFRQFFTSTRQPSSAKMMANTVERIPTVSAAPASVAHAALNTQQPAAARNEAFKQMVAPRPSRQRTRLEGESGRVRRNGLSDVADIEAEARADAIQAMHQRSGGKESSPVQPGLLPTPEEVRGVKASSTFSLPSSGFSSEAADSAATGAPRPVQTASPPGAVSAGSITSSKSAGQVPIAFMPTSVMRKMKLINPPSSNKPISTVSVRPSPSQQTSSRPPAAAPPNLGNQSNPHVNPLQAPQHAPFQQHFPPQARTKTDATLDSDAMPQRHNDEQGGAVASFSQGLVPPQSSQTDAAAQLHSPSQGRGDSLPMDKLSELAALNRKELSKHKLENPYYQHRTPQQLYQAMAYHNTITKENLPLQPPPGSSGALPMPQHAPSAPPAVQTAANVFHVRVPSSSLHGPRQTAQELERQICLSASGPDVARRAAPSGVTGVRISLQDLMSMPKGPAVPRGQGTPAQTTYTTTQDVRSAPLEPSVHAVLHGNGSGGNGTTVGLPRPPRQPSDFGHSSNAATVPVTATAGSRPSPSQQQPTLKMAAMFNRSGSN